LVLLPVSALGKASYFGRVIVRDDLAGRIGTITLALASAAVPQ
jgi:hypothetical protein